MGFVSGGAHRVNSKKARLSAQNRALGGEET